ncbi:exodeoxyribonuclease VII, large subunit [Caldicellulosiruptor obsidiansis OB47]|uniref:Exodeoxyribonuclease 7 large subunit n=1 Tax=Caldicellulosiruptor obsidiansis (strain ATCC BAA-2073 / JCM 16842 / OB47) TaxID=608506 RepID=D9TLB7_CALOO|nr:exodeoxyribonuclease VII large subunit [Caldicellulosiruptor obsidiansis]ADL42799.1 exodeoxyribonuclease VII, large subunit [Caldicellulosiruptor obsidiansis OB47]
MMINNVVSKKEWSVYELTSYLKKKVEMDVLLKNIYLKGEVIRPSVSGDHLYFELKDLEYDAKIKCVFFWFDKSVEIKHGSKVLVKGNVIFYEKEGIIELKITEITDIGLGELFVKLKQLEEKLKQEGLFDSKYKKEIPRYPKKVGIVTSKNGAAIRDILNTIYTRFENIQVYIYSCSVQGQNAPYEICEGIEYFNTAEPVEVIIVGRGGGAFEDLMAFNSEMVVRKIFESKIPVISAVGHERDYVLSDFVADMRAITPTNAGEIVVSFQNKALEKLNEYHKRMKSAMEKIFNIVKEKVGILQYKLYQNSPANTIAKRAQDIDLYCNKLSFAISRKLHEVHKNLKNFEKRLADANPESRLSIARTNFDNCSRRLGEAFKKIFQQKEFMYKVNLEKLIALNPLNVLKRGYSITLHNSKILTTIAQVNNGDEIVTQLSDGIIKSKVFFKKEGAESDV